MLRLAGAFFRYVLLVQYLLFYVFRIFNHDSILCFIVSLRELAFHAWLILLTTLGGCRPWPWPDNFGCKVTCHLIRLRFLGSFGFEGRLVFSLGNRLARYRHVFYFIWFYVISFYYVLLFASVFSLRDALLTIVSSLRSSVAAVAAVSGLDGLSSIPSGMLILCFPLCRVMCSLSRRNPFVLRDESHICLAFELTNMVVRP